MSGNVPPRVPMLARKIVADTRYLGRRALGLVVLMGLGSMLFTGLYQSYQNLTTSYGYVYRVGRFADASVLVDSAPEGLVRAAEGIPHVLSAIGRPARDGAIKQPGRPHERAMGRFIGVPRGRRPKINDLLLTEGRYIRGVDEAVLEQQFAQANDYELGDRIQGVYRATEREFTIVGFATSPEYLYPVPSEEMSLAMPGTFGVLFIDDDRAREWFGLGRRITEIHCRIDPGHQREVLAKLKGLANPYGLQTGYIQDDQPSKKLLTMDQQGLATLSVFFPVLFLGASVLFLYSSLSRIVRMQLSVIGTLKALGFGNRALLAQYVAQGLLISWAGALPGALLGHGLSILLAEAYADSLNLSIVKAPFHWDTLGASLALAGLTGLAGALGPARAAARLRPAVAMRGDVEPDGPRGRRNRLMEATRCLPVAYRIPVRGLFRRVSRTLLAVAGISGGATITLTTLGMGVSTLDAIDEALNRTRLVELDVGYATLGPGAIATAISGLPGTRAVSHTVSLPVRLRSASGEGKVLLMGVEPGQDMLRITAAGGGRMVPRKGQIWLPRRLGERLAVDPGDPLRVQWTGASRRRPDGRTLRVAGFIDLAIGGVAYGHYEDIRRGLADRVYPYSSYGSMVDCVPGAVSPLRHRLERSDDVAIVYTRRDFQQQVNQQMGIFYIFMAVLLGFGAVLSGCAIQSVASVSLLERTRELATLRSLGFSARATAGLAALELYALAALGLVVGLPIGAHLNALYIQSYSTDTMTFHPLLPPWTYVTTAALVFGLVAWVSRAGRRYLRDLDLAQATKIRE
ncbi:MAG TPA: ABC transporter permease [Armatimonadota bacterium]|nr:ABC transporter permease [Armatimonadota bacterium]